ncbi:MAG: thiamine phosphate synthase [Clostridiales bacterium]|jgi:2-dehydro-3-deoxyphosphogluconate aldolase/(4S)-4-hydroxy-2-oxoglutarate aldolase|nr:thiamine phosphate synthase [Clostridiales bacterium]
MMREKVISRVLRDKLVAIVRDLDGTSILKLAEALCSGGIHMMEVAFNQSRPESFGDVARAIEAIQKRYGEDMYAGAGTVATMEQLSIAAEARALYVISPNTNADVIKAARSAGLVSMPGAFTPSECLEAHAAGADFIKLFPIAQMGSAYLKALRAPLSHLRFIGVGGVDSKNIREFMAAGAAGFGVGGNLVSKTLVETGDFDEITKIARGYVKAVEAATGEWHE